MNDPEKTLPAATTAHPTPQAALRAEIATRLATSGADVRELVISDLTKVEIDRRAVAVKALIIKIDDHAKALKKIVDKDGTYAFNTNGDKIGEPTFTKDQAEAIKKYRDEITKFQTALSKAFDEGDFSKVLEFGK